nr:MAG TPA_asm: hypothetical protein [Bacteriophage sp.]
MKRFQKKNFTKVILVLLPVQLIKAKVLQSPVITLF